MSSCGALSADFENVYVLGYILFPYLTKWLAHIVVTAHTCESASSRSATCSRAAFFVSESSSRLPTSILLSTYAFTCTHNRSLSITRSFYKPRHRNQGLYTKLHIKFTNIRGFIGQFLNSRTFKSLWANFRA